MNVLTGYTKGTLSDNYLLSAAGGHIPLGNTSGSVPLSNNTLNKDLFADKARILPYFTIPSSGDLSDPNDATKLIPKYIKIGTINIPQTSWYRGSIMLIFHDYEIYKLNGDILMIQCITSGNKVGALPAIRWKTKHDKSTEDSIILSKVDDNTYDLYLEAKFSWMTFYVYYLTKEVGVFNFNVGSWSQVQPNPITTRSTLQNVSSEALTLSPEYVRNLNNVTRDTFINGGFQATSTPYSNYFTGISLSNSELKYKYQFGFSTTGIPFVRYNNTTAWQPWKQLAFTSDISSQYVTLTTDQTITGLKTFESNSSTTGVSLILKNKGWAGSMQTAMDFYNGSNYKVPNARISTLMNGSGRAGGTLIFYTQTKASANPNPNGLVERFRIGDDNTSKLTGDLTVDGKVNDVTIKKLFVSDSGETQTTVYDTLNVGTDYVLASIRYAGSKQSVKDPWLANYYSAGIGFGGKDTKGALSLGMYAPNIKFAAADSNSGWWLQLTGTGNKSYNLDQFTTLTKTNELLEDYLPRQRMTNPSHTTSEIGGIPFNVLALKAAGTPLYDDPEFLNGTNQVYIYNNSSNNNVSIKHINDDGLSSANSSGKILQISSTSGETAPGRGGFHQLIQSRKNAIFVQIFRAKIPVGYKVVNAENSMGAGYNTYWLTDQAGTGKWEWYCRVTQCGTDGFSTGGHVYLEKTDPSASNAVTWYLSYCNVFDLSKGNYDGLRTKLADSVAWSGITNKPTSFTPSDHASSLVTSLSGYSKATSASDLATTDTLNAALGKLEYKSDYAYDWIINVTAIDTDTYINKWGEIVGFLDSMKEGTDILDQFVTRKTDQTITGAKTFNGGVTLSCGLNINSTNPITWNDGSYHQRIQTTDDSNTNTPVFTFQQSKDTGVTWDSLFTIKDNGYVTANKFITSGGTSSQFVKGDGSLDSNTYATKTSLNSYLPLTGGTVTGLITLGADNYAKTIKWANTDFDFATAMAFMGGKGDWVLRTTYVKDVDGNVLENKETADLRFNRNTLKIGSHFALTSGNYTNYINETNFPGLKKTGTVTSITVTGANGLSGTGTITTTGTITLSNSGVRSVSIVGDKLRINTNGTNSDLTIPYATKSALLTALDVRSDNILPNTYNKGLQYLFIANSTDNLNDGGGYHGVIHLRPYGTTTDLTGAHTHQLAFSDNGRIYLRNARAADTSWSDWKKVAWVSEIPTSLKNPNALTIFGINYDGSVAQTITANTMISTLQTGTSDVTDYTEILTSYASDNGFVDPNAPNTVYKRSAIKVYNYIKGKLDSVYQPKGSYLTSRGYIGNTAVQETSAIQALTGISGITFSGGNEYFDQYGNFRFGTAGTTWGVYHNDGNVLLKLTKSTGQVEAKSFKVTGGTSSQFLKANGSIDNNTYLTSSSSIPDTSITWSKTGKSGSVGPIAVPLCDPLKGNRFAGIVAEAVSIEYSRDAGTTWTDYEEAGDYFNSQKRYFFTQFAASFILGKNDDPTTSNNNYRLRVTIDCHKGSVYSRLDKAIMYVTTNGSTNCQVVVQVSKDGMNYTDHRTQGLNGWSGYNEVPLGFIADNQESRSTSGYYRYIRFLFSANYSAQSTNPTNYSRGLTIMGIEVFGGVGWTTPNNHIAKYGRPYTFDYLGQTQFYNSVYPAANNSYNLGSPERKWYTIYASSFIGNVTGNATTATTASNVIVGTGSTNAYRAIVVHNGNALYSAGTTTGKPCYNYSTGDIKAKSFTTDGGLFIGAVTSVANISSAASSTRNLTITQAGLDITTSSLITLKLTSNWQAPVDEYLYLNINSNGNKPIKLNGNKVTLLNAGTYTLLFDGSNYNIVLTSYTTYGIATASKAGLVKPNSVITKPTINAVTTTAGKYYHVQMSSDGNMFVNVPWSPGSYTLPLAANGTKGGIQIGYSESGTNYAVKLSSEKAYVTVPWTDTKVKQTAKSDNVAYPLLLGPSSHTSGNAAEAYYDSGVTLNPSTNTITANINGNVAGSSSSCTGNAENANRIASTTTSTINSVIYNRTGSATKGNAAGNAWQIPTEFPKTNAMILRMNWHTTAYGHDIVASPNNNELWHRNYYSANHKWAKLLDSQNCYGVYNIKINSNNISIEHISGKQLIPNIEEIPIQGANRAYYAWTADETPSNYDELVFLIQPKAKNLSGGGFYYYNLTAVVNQYGIYILCDSNDPSGLQGYASDNVPCRTIIFHL